MIEITLPNWLYQAIKKTKILKISPKYFRIRKAINRRIYEIARKHCSFKKRFTIKLNNLYLKTGSNSNLAKFKFNMKKLVKLNDLPDYNIKYDTKKNNIIFTNKNNSTIFYKQQKKNQKEIQKIKNKINSSKKNKKI